MRVERWTSPSLVFILNKYSWPLCSLITTNTICIFQYFCVKSIFAIFSLYYNLETFLDSTCYIVVVLDIVQVRSEVVLGVDMRTSIVSVFVKNSLDSERQDNLIYFAFKETF